MSHAAARRVIGSAVLALGLLSTAAVSPSAAQNAPAAGTEAGSSTQADNDEGGFDMGWLGLLGLLGLMGMRRREPVRVDRVERVDTTASTRPRV